MTLQTADRGLEMDFDSQILGHLLIREPAGRQNILMSEAWGPGSALEPGRVRVEGSNPRPTTDEQSVLVANLDAAMTRGRCGQAEDSTVCWRTCPSAGLAALLYVTLHPSLCQECSIHWLHFPESQVAVATARSLRTRLHSESHRFCL